MSDCVNGNTCSHKCDNDVIKLSVVVPVYNAGKYLRPCLDSLVNQNVPQETYEVICVNDGSTDDSLQILQEYENKFSCITVISQENAGHAAARNTGFDNTKGKYVWFVDSDDVIDWNCFGIIYDLFDKYSLDGLCVEYMPVPSAYDGDTHKKGVDGVKILKKQSHYSCSGIRLFSADLLRSNNIHWDDRLSPCDDIKFIFQYTKHAKTQIRVKGISYYHRQVENSASHVRNEKALRKKIESFLLLADFYDSELGDTKWTAKERKNILTRRNLCVQTVMLCLTSLSEEEMLGYLQTLKDKGYYPYKHIAWNLRPKISLKRVLVDYSLYLFPNEKYYLWFYRKFKKK